MKTINRRPPVIARILMELFCYHEEISSRLGDFEEIFHTIAVDRGYFQARYWYWSQVLQSIPAFLFNSMYWSMVMFKNYLKIGLRNLYKNKLYSLINIIGLGAAIAVCITGYINYQYSQSFDNYLINSDKIHLVNTYRIVNNNRLNLANSPTPLTPAIKKDMPGIDNYIRLARNNGVLRYKNQVFNETVYYLDENFFDIFSFTLVNGNRNALKQKNSIILTDEIAAKYFGDTDPIGKQIIFSPNGDNEYIFYVGAIIAKPPSNSSMRLSVCIPYEKQRDILGFDLEAWNDWTSAAFIQTNGKIAPAEIEKQLKVYQEIVNQANPNYQADGFYLTPLPQISASTRTLNSSPFNQGMHLSQIIAPSIMALLVLLLACFNFVNTAVAFASKRMKEIGIRKVIGGKRSQLIRQFMGENFILCFFAFTLGLLLAQPFTRFYDSLFPENIFTIHYIQNPGILIFLTGLLIFTAFAAGAYPALYISRFNPTIIFRGKQQFGGTNPLIRTLLSLQFAISIATILSSIIMYKNSAFIENYDLGFDKEQVLVLPVNSERNYDVLKAAIRNNPDIISIGGSEHLMGRSWQGRDIEINQNSSRMSVFNVGENYFRTVGFTLLEGRPFDPDLKTETDESVIINQATVNTFGLESPIGQLVKFTSSTPQQEYRVIGVVKDFHLQGLWRKVDPMVIRYAPRENYRFLSVKFHLNNLKNVSEYMQQTWKTVFPHLPYEGFFQSEIIAESVLITESIQRLFLYIALIVVITSGMGLFALVSLNIVKRTKEIGIRKVLGANIFDISYLISREFIKLMLIASIIGFGLGYWSLDAFMSSIWAYYVDFGFWPFLLASLMMLMIALITVSSQVFSVARTNPVDAIRYE